MSTISSTVTVSPFTDNPDAPVFIETRPHRQAIAKARYIIEQDGGIVVITGDAGTGKSTLLDRLALLCDDRDNVILRLSGMELDTQSLDTAILKELVRKDQQTDPDATAEEALAQCQERGLTVILLLDNAGSLQDKDYRIIKRLSDIGDSGEPLLRIVLAGRSPLRSVFYRDDMSGLRDNIAGTYHLSTLEQEDIAAYVEGRIYSAGFGGEIKASEKFLDALATQSDGIPARINKLAGRAITAADMAGRQELLAQDLEDKSSEERKTDSSPIEDAEIIVEPAEALSLSGKARVDTSLDDVPPAPVTVRQLNAAIEQLGQQFETAKPRPPASPQEMISEPSPLMQQAAAFKINEDLWEAAVEMSDEEAAHLDAVSFETESSEEDDKTQALLGFVNEFRTQLDELRTTVDTLRQETTKLEESRQALREKVSTRLRGIEERLNDLRAPQ